jgi:hypothetical protein
MHMLVGLKERSFFTCLFHEYTRTHAIAVCFIAAELFLTIVIFDVLQFIRLLVLIYIHNDGLDAFCIHSTLMAKCETSIEIAL